MEMQPEQSGDCERENRFPDYVRPADLGMTADEVRQRFPHVPEHGSKIDPYWNLEEIESSM